MIATIIFTYGYYGDHLYTEMDLWKRQFNIVATVKREKIKSMKLNGSEVQMCTNFTLKKKTETSNLQVAAQSQVRKVARK